MACALDEPEGLRRAIVTGTGLPESTSRFLLGLTEKGNEPRKHHRETAVQDMNAFRSGALDSVLGGPGGSVDLVSALDASRQATIYLAMPEAEMRSHAVYLRMFLWCVTRTIARHPQPRGSVLIVADEIAQLGRADALVDALAFSRSSGGRLISMWPGTEQMRHLYGERTAMFSSNAALRIHLSFADPDARRLVSDELGNCSAIDGDDVVTRPLVVPEEFLLLPRDTMLVTGLSTRPMLLRKLPLQERPELTAGSASNRVRCAVPKNGGPRAPFRAGQPAVLLGGEEGDEEDWLAEAMFRAERRVVRSIMDGAPEGTVCSGTSGLPAQMRATPSSAKATS